MDALTHQKGARLVYHSPQINNLLPINHKLQLSLQALLLNQLHGYNLSHHHLLCLLVVDAAVVDDLQEEDNHVR